MRPGRNVHADDLGERVVLRELGQQPALAAAEIEDPTDADGAQRREDRPDPLLVKADPLLDLSLLGIVLDLGRLGILLLLGDEPAQRFPRQVGLAGEVAAGNELALRVVREPALAAAEQLVDLGLVDPIVLLVVEHRDQEIEVAEKVAKPKVH